MIKEIKESIEYIKNIIETTATASVKAILQSTYKVRIENQTLDVNVKNLSNPLPIKGDVIVKNQADYTGVFIELQRGLEALAPLLKKLDKDPKVSVTNLRDIKLPTKLEISNPQKKVEVSNLDALYKAILSVKKSIDELPKEFPDIKIPETKIPEFPKFPDIKFPKIPEFPKEISVKDLQKLIKLAEKLTDGNPKEPIAVRLSDGKKFYEALTEFFTTGGGGTIPFTKNGGGRMEALITGKREQVVSMVDRFSNNDIDAPNETTNYIGQENIDGEWMITKITQSGTVNSFRYATVKNNSSKSTYTSAWSARTSLSYGKVSEALT